MTNSQRDENTREMGKPGSFLVGCAIGLCLLLTVGVFVVWRAKKAEDARRSLTLDRLTDLGGLLRMHVAVPPHADGAGEDWTGMRTFVDAVNARQKTYNKGEDLEEVPSVLPRGEWLDGWGHPIRYRCPGVVHKKGWDFYSCGPNGRDDQGEFDDLVVGEDAAVTSAAH
jgi:hypothetical protein